MNVQNARKLITQLKVENLTANKKDIAFNLEWIELLNASISRALEKSLSKNIFSIFK